MAIVVAVIALAIRLPFLSMSGFPADQALFVGWAYQAQQAGLASVYDRVAGGRPFCNYPPLYIYVLRALAALQNRVADAPGQLNAQTQQSVWSGAADDPSAALAKVLHKLPGILADAVVVFLLCFWLWPAAGPAMALAVALVYAVTPAAVHDSAVWGQVDGIPALLMLLSLESARRRHLAWMAAWATLALLMKAQALMIAPIWLAVAWCAGRRNPVELARAAGVSIAIAVVVLLPFTDALGGVWAGYARAAKYYPFAHFNGFSAWFLGHPLDSPQLAGALSKAYVHDDVPGLLGITARTWAMLGLLVLWGRVFLELIARGADEASLRWAARLLPLGFFVLSTQMHERYLFPAIALWAWAAQPTRRWWLIWITLSLCAAINQLWVWPGPRQGEFARNLAGMLHHQWVGMTVSVVLIALFVATFLEQPGRNSTKLRG